jgi:hypothetical protein
MLHKIVEHNECATLAGIAVSAQTCGCAIYIKEISTVPTFLYWANYKFDRAVNSFGIVGPLQCVSKYLIINWPRIDLLQRR